jgi:hypothetical protein
MEKQKSKVVPKDHPVAWKSELWPHEELIRSMRRGRKSYPEICDHLKEEYGITISPPTVRNFYIRSTKRKHRGLPSGWPNPEPHPPGSLAQSSTKEPSIIDQIKARAKDINQIKPDTNPEWEDLDPSKL